MGLSPAPNCRGVSASPPTIPDGGFSPVRFWPWLSCAGLPTIVAKFKRWHTSTPLTLVCLLTRPRFEGRFFSAQCPRTTLGPPSAQSPFAPSRRYRTWGRRQASPRRTLLLLHRSYGLMRRTSALRPPLALPRANGLRRLLSAPAAQRSFPTLALLIFPHVSGSLLRLLPRCSRSILPLGHWPSPH